MLPSWPPGRGPASANALVAPSQVGSLGFRGRPASLHLAGPRGRPVQALGRRAAAAPGPRGHADTHAGPVFRPPRAGLLCANRGEAPSDRPTIGPGTVSRCLQSWPSCCASPSPLAHPAGATCPGSPAVAHENVASPAAWPLGGIDSATGARLARHPGRSWVSAALRRVGVLAHPADPPGSRTAGQESTWPAASSVRSPETHRAGC